MEVRLLTNEETEYRTYSLIHFYQFGIIPSDVGHDFIDEGMLSESFIVFPPIDKSFRSVELTSLGLKRFRKWTKLLGMKLTDLAKLEDFYDTQRLEHSDKFFMSYTRLKSELMTDKSRKLFTHYQFNTSP